MLYTKLFRKINYVLRIMTIAPQKQWNRSRHMDVYLRFCMFHDGRHHGTVESSILGKFIASLNKNLRNLFRCTAAETKDCIEL
jgi:hypothetical protein